MTKEKAKFYEIFNFSEGKVYRYFVRSPFLERLNGAISKITPWVKKLLLGHKAVRTPL